MFPQTFKTNTWTYLDFVKLRVAVASSLIKTAAMCHEVVHVMREAMGFTTCDQLGKERPRRQRLGAAFFECAIGIHWTSLDHAS